MVKNWCANAERNNLAISTRTFEGMNERNSTKPGATWQYSKVLELNWVQTRSSNNSFADIQEPENSVDI